VQFVPNAKQLTIVPHAKLHVCVPTMKVAPSRAYTSTRYQLQVGLVVTVMFQIPFVRHAKLDRERPLPASPDLVCAR
jgi:hypothetical protein